MSRFPDRATTLEIGLVLTAAAIVGGLATLVFGRGLGGLVRRGRRSAAPPSPGSISPNRHQNVTGSAAR